jgi:hypothetical protein
MKTAVDSNILLDVLLPDPIFGERSLAALEREASHGSLVASGSPWLFIESQAD